MPFQSTSTSVVVTALETANPYERAHGTLILLPHGKPIASPNLAAHRGMAAGNVGHIALLDAIAHVGLNDIDLALNIACRFDGQAMPNYF